MQVIVAIAQKGVWENARKTGVYTQSTVESTLADVGFIHCSTPDQTIAIANRHFTAYDDLVLLLIDADTVKPEVKFEAAPSGRAGLFPHIYGPLNVDAVIKTILLPKDKHVQFMTPPELQPYIGLPK